MARYPKGSKGNTERSAQAAQPPVATGESVEQAPEAKETQEAPKTATGENFSFDRRIYHNEHSPRILKAGVALPEGWHLDRVGLKVLWLVDDFGNWSRHEKN